MGYVTYLGGLENNLNTYADSKFVMLSVVGFGHSLVLSEFGQDGYNSSLTGFISQDGRSLTGSLKTFKNNQKPAEQWEISECVINEIQKDAFIAILNYRNFNNVPITLTDVFTKYLYIPGINTLPTWYGSTEISMSYTKGFSSWNVHIDVDSGFITWLGENRYLLQFSALQL